MSEKYKTVLHNLLPLGKIWNKSSNNYLSKLLEGIGAEFQRVENRALDLLKESDPRTASESLEDWERFLGLPDDCDVDNDSSLERRYKLINRALSFRGGQTPQYFIDYIKALGFDATIYEYKEFRAGLSSAGDPISNGIEWVNTWQLNLPATLAYDFSAGVSVAGEPLRVFRNESVECSVGHIKPAQTKVIFAFET